jgi:8-oxo-dGTP pyrophosphatase MutT (NUDIX family)
VKSHPISIKNPRNEWELPGGRSESGEDHFQTLSREFAGELSIVTYGCTLAGEFTPRVSDEHTDHCLWPVSRLSEINLPAGYRESVEKWANAI